jgi:hypothetical protein
LAQLTCHPDDGGCENRRNIGKFISAYTALQLRRLTAVKPRTLLRSNWFGMIQDRLDPIRLVSVIRWFGCVWHITWIWLGGVNLDYVVFCYLKVE